MTIPGIPLREVLLLWSELDDCLAHRNSFGGDTAELYAYRFVGRCPIAENDSLRGTTTHAVAESEMAHEAADGLVWLCEAFATLRACVVTIDGLPPAVWRGRIGAAFTHRVRVIVTEGRS